MSNAQPLGAEQEDQLSDSGLIEEPKANSDTQKDTDGELFNSEQDDDNLLEEAVIAEPSKPDQSAKQKQVDAWVGKILAGEATIADLPNNLQWLKTPVLKELRSLEMTPELESKMEKIASKMLAEKESALEFDRMKSDLNKLDLSKSEKAELSAEFKDLLDAGVPRTKALAKAMKIVGINADAADMETEELRRSMSIPRGGNAPQETDELDPLDILKKHKTSEDRVEYWEKIRKGSGRK